MNNDRLFFDTSGGPIPVTLPASPSVGDNVRVMDVASNFATNNLIIGRNGETIVGDAADLTVDNDDAAFQLIYTGATNGWKLAEV